MLLSPFWFVIAAIAGTFITAVLFHGVTRRPVKPLTAVAGQALSAALAWFCLWQCFTHLERGDYGVLRTLGVALLAPMAFDFFSVAGLGMNKTFAEQPASVRIGLRSGVSVVGWMLTMTLMEVGSRTFGISSISRFIVLVPVSALLALSGLVFFLLKIPPEEQDTKAFLLRAARRMLVARVNLLTINNLLVYVGIAMGITGTLATTLTGVLFGLNFFASCFLSSHVDTAALDPKQSDTKTKPARTDTSIIAENDTTQPTRAEPFGFASMNDEGSAVATVSAGRL